MLCVDMVVMSQLAIMLPPTAAVACMKMQQQQQKKTLPQPTLEDTNYWVFP